MTNKHDKTDFDQKNQLESSTTSKTGPGTTASLLDVVSIKFQISRGQPMPLGATLQREGINFALFSSAATEVTLVLFTPDQTRPLAEFPLDPKYNRTGDVWHLLVQGLDADIEYGFRVDRQPNDEPHIHRFDSTRVLIDPYARALSGHEQWGLPVGNQMEQPGCRSWRSLIIDENFDWEFDQPLNIPLEKTVIYELHVRGFTQHKSSKVHSPGTYAGLIEKIPYLKQLGITAVELLPVNEFCEMDNDRRNPETGENLSNFWGYNSVGFFAPKASYASVKTPGAQVIEFKSMVKAFHKAGIEVILDVVFNHTGEGNLNGPTISFRGIDNSVYYLIDPESGEYHNFTGCGNTINCNHPVVRDMILECLRYWVTQMHIDGFRFDLASVLGRGRDGTLLANPPLLERIAADPVLRDAKLIAEAWDAAGVYQVGTFPSWGRWAEWNARFRDDVRSFIKGDGGMAQALANRLMGSPDVYSSKDVPSHHHINFITCHDGFTLRDLVSYNEKQNLANGENSRDGSNDNRSWNCGHEGAVMPGEIYNDLTADEIENIRQHQVKNLATILLLSRGVPMILAGDEFGRTQGGNNNAYCQDNDISWIDWKLTEKNADLLRFFKLLIEFRKEHSSLAGLPADQPPAREGSIHWHGVMPNCPDWSWASRSLAMQFTETESGNTIDIYLVANAHHEPLQFNLPGLSGGRLWRRVIDTLLPGGEDFAEPTHEPIIEPQSLYVVGPRSTVVLLGR